MKTENRPARNLFLCLLVSRTVSLLANLLFDESLQWQVHDVSMHLSLVLVIALCASMISYAHVAAKCIAFAWFGFEGTTLVESIFNVWDVSFPMYTIAFHATGAICLSAWYILRRSRAEPDQLDQVHLFVCRLRPRGAQDILLAMCGRSALGSIAIYYKGALWHYRRGVLVKSPFGNAERYVAFRAGIPASTTIEFLDNMIGQKWAIHRNCVTNLYAAAMLGRPLFHRIS